MDEAKIYAERRERLLKAGKDFAGKLEALPSVIEVLLIGSLATNDIYPYDIDLVVFLNNFGDISRIAKSARQITPIYHGWEVFVISHDFDTQDIHPKDLQYRGRICKRKRCPSTSIDCTVFRCGEIKHIQVLSDFTFDPKIFLSSPFKLFWTRRSISLFEEWRESQNITEIRVPEMVLEPIYKKCIECGDRFVYSVAEQKIFEKRGFHPPKRCEDCRLKKHFPFWDEDML
jgi:hypothetical protein